mgnify:FL=1
MKKRKAQRLKVMVSSSVYKLGFNEVLDQIISCLKTSGYEVISSYYNTVKTYPGLSNLDNCLKAVEECDIFLGIIRPYCGSGYVTLEKEGKTERVNITFEEFKHAIQLDKPRWFLVHEHVPFARNLFSLIKPVGITEQDYMSLSAEDKLKTLFECIQCNKNDMFDYTCVDMYNHVIKNDPHQAWAAPFNKSADALRFIQNNFADYDKMADIVSHYKTLKQGGTNHE